MPQLRPAGALHQDGAAVLALLEALTGWQGRQPGADAAGAG